jgi:hypothetical protein
MATAKVEGVVFDASEPAIGTFLNLVTPKRVSQSTNETPTFSANFEMPADGKDLPRLRSAIVEAARQLWPNMDVGAQIKAGELVVPLADGEALANKAADKSRVTGKERLREWSRGKFVLTSRSKEDYAPSLTIVSGGKVIELADKDARQAADRQHFYSGQRVLFGVRLKAYEAVGVNGKPGVKAYLEVVHSCGGGERLLGNKADATERFKDYIGLDSQEDPVAANSGEW